jgi:hypothetical protein
MSFFPRFFPIVAALTLTWVISTQAHAETPPSHADSTWSDTLWEQGNAFLKEGKLREASQSFREITQKQVGTSHYTEAHEALGRTLLAMNQPREAIPYLEQARRAWGASEKADSPIQLLIQARLQSGDARGATLLAREWITRLESAQKKRGDKTPDSKLQGALLSEIEGRMTLKQNERAATQLRDPRLAPQLLNAEHRGQAGTLHLWLGKRKCERPRPKHLSEAQALSEIERHGLCLRELTPTLGETIESGASAWISRSLEFFRDANLTWLERCQQAPLPPATSRKTPSELKSYLDELQSEQVRRCRQLTREWLAALAKPERPPIVIQESLNSTQETHWEAFRTALRKSAETKLGRLDP